MKLTEKQKRFADYYIKTTNATESYKLAGYSANNDNVAGVEGSKLLKNPKISRYIEDKLNKMDSKRIMKMEEALELITSIARGEMTEELYIPTEKGVQRVEKTPDIKDRQKALDSLLKRYPINEHDQLRNKMLEMQIKKIEKELQTENTTEDKLKEYFQALGSAFRES